MNREIRSGEIVNINCKYSYIDTTPPVEEDGREIIKTGTEKMDTPIHQDLKRAFINIIPHFILLCEQVEETKEIRNAIKDGIPEGIIPTTSIFYPYNVHQFEVKGSSKKEGVSFKGTRILRTGEVLNLTFSRINWDDNDYPYMAELIEAVEILKEETYLYTQGKQQPPPPDLQEAMDFDSLDMSVAAVDDNGEI
tara:strand:+ start:3948 stop:4529 length:582 start_codon:yes stop_codon:yes gene_type:complete